MSDEVIRNYVANQFDHHRAEPLTPEEAALALLNNAELWFHNRYSAAMQLEYLETVFQPGYYAGTCGEATTAQIKSYLATRFDADCCRLMCG